MGSILPHCALLHIQTYTMVATKVLISLCMLGLSAAATTVQRTKRQANQETAIVDTVVTSLQPQIATAVADALSALRRQQEAQEAAERAAYEAQLRAQQEAEARARAQQEAEERARLAALGLRELSNRKLSLLLTTTNIRSGMTTPPPLSTSRN